jgi:hypothetical protein
MAKKNVTGICKLCLTYKILRKSHYISKSLYRLTRLEGRNPIVATPAVIDETPRQLWKHLLCSECEDKLSRRGERYAIDMIHRGARFSLLERIKLAMPIGLSGDVPMFSGLQLGIETEKLAYFALSLVWRGTQGPWKTIEGQTTEVSLGQFEEPMRGYLRGDFGWPAKVVVVATICTDRGSQEWINAPWPIPNDVAGGNFTRIELLVRGIWFWVLMGETQKVLFVRDCEDQFLLMNRHFLETAEDRISAKRLN